MSEYKGKVILGAVLAVIIAFGLAGATILVTPPITSSSTQSQHSSTTQSPLTTTITVTSSHQVTVTSQQVSTSSSSSQAGQSVLLVQLTDPPIVPAGTTALNLTYSAIILLVAEPVVTTRTSTSIVTESSTTSTVTSTITQTQSGLVTPQSITISTSGTVNLLKLQNISETLASANVPNGSMIYSVSFVVSSITVTINGVTSPVTLATGGTTLLVTLAKPASLQGTNAMLVDLTPTVVNTTTGYQIIPSAVGIIKPQSEISAQQQQVGHEGNLTNQDRQDIKDAVGNVTANLLSLSVSGNVTTLTVQVNNTGNAAVHLVAIDIHGNFTSQNSVCSTTTTETSTTTNENNFDQGQQGCFGNFFGNLASNLVLIPNSTSGSTTTSGCIPGQLYTLQGNEGRSGDNQVTLSSGQCITLTFSGTIPFGPRGGALVPSIASGQQYTIQIIASNSAETMLNCALPVSTSSCTPVQNNSEGNGN